MAICVVARATRIAVTVPRRRRARQATVAHRVDAAFDRRAFFVVDGLQTIAAASLRGFNDTRRAVLCLRPSASGWSGFACAYLLAFKVGLGAVGIWIGLSIGIAVYAVAAGLALSAAHRRGLSARQRATLRTRYDRTADDRTSRPSRRRHRRWPGRADLRALYAARRNRRGRAMARPSRPPASAARRSPRAHERIAPICPHFGVMRRLRDAALELSALSRMEARHSWSAALQQAGLECDGRRPDRCARRWPPPRDVSRAPRRRMKCSTSASQPRSRITSCRSTAVRSLRLRLMARCRRLGDRASARSGEKAARYPGDRDRRRHRHGRARLRAAAAEAFSATGAGCRRTSAGAAHPPWRADRAARCAERSASGHANVELPPGAFLQATVEGEETLAQLVISAPCAARRQWSICSAASVRSRCASPNSRASSLPTAMRRPSPRLRKPRRRPGLKPVQARDARSVPPAVSSAQELKADADRVRSAAPGRRSAGARDRQEQSTWSSPCRAIRRHSRATRKS